MGVTRTKLDFEGKFVQIPNEWVRDERLSRKARGLLVEIMSHRVGWHVSVSSLQKAGTEGRDAIRSGLAELLSFGYLKRRQEHGDAGRFNEVEYELNDPATADGKPVSGGLAVSGSPVDGSPDVGKSDTKNTTLLEDQFPEDQELLIAPGGAIEILDKDPFFEIIWDLWPKKDDKKDALARWPKAVKEFGGTAQQLCNIASEHAHAYRAHRTRQLTPALVVWLNKARWDNEPVGPDTTRRQTPTERAMTTLSLATDIEMAAIES